MNSPDSLALVTLCCRALADKKAEDLRVLAVGEKSSVTDYLIIATGNSEPHLRALRVDLEKAVDASGTRIVGMESPHDSGWIVMDLFDVMVHLFLPDMRKRYRLEHLWREVPEVSVPRLLGEPEPVAPSLFAPKPAATLKKKAPAKKAPAKKPAAPLKKKALAKKAVKTGAKKKPAVKKKAPAKKPAAKKKSRK
jgi:ribosome-associated protein